MNWQETVVENTFICVGFAGDTDTVDIKHNLEAQAKATWEACQKEVDEAEQRGIRKVVEFCKQKIFNTFIDRDTGEPYIAFRDNADKEWQAFLKDAIKPVKEGKDEQI